MHTSNVLFESTLMTRNEANTKSDIHNIIIAIVSHLEKTLAFAWKKGWLTHIFQKFEAKEMSSIMPVWSYSPLSVSMIPHSLKHLDIASCYV
jgi:hypothetical protein